MNTSAQSQSNKALPFIAKLGGDKELDRELRDNASRKEQSKIAALLFMSRMRADIGDDGMNSLPVPGSKEGNNPDKYDDTDEEGKTVHKSVIKDIVNAMPFAVEINSVIELIKTAQNTPDKAIEPYASMGNIELENQLAKQKQRLTASHSLFGTSITLWHKWIEVSDYDTVTVEFATETVNGAEVFVSTPTPIILSDAAKPSTFCRLSIQQFNKLDLDKAEAAGGTWKDLKAQVGKKPSQKKGKVTEIKRIKDVTVFFDYLNMISQFLDWESKDGQENQTKVKERLAGKNSDELVRTVGTAAHNLDTVYGSISDRFDRIMSAKAQAA